MKDSPDVLSDVPTHNVMVDCRLPHGELLDLSSGTVWQSQESISRREYEALVLPDEFRRIGLGTGVMDAHYFRRSPGRETDGPVTERMIDGHRFVHCANPPRDGGDNLTDDGPVLLRVDKHHTLVFAAGREIDVLLDPDGRQFVQVIASAPEGGSLLQSSVRPPPLDVNLPAGWSIRTVSLRSRAVIHLPNPTEALFFANGASYQGPVEALVEPKV